MGTLGGGGLSGGGGNINSLGGVSITAPTNGQFLVYNSIAMLWENSNGGGSSGYVTIQGQGVAVAQETKLNFVSAAFTVADDALNNRTNVSLTLPSAYNTIKNAGVAVAQETIINFATAGITAVDNGGAGSTDVSLAATLQDVAGLTPTAGNVILGNLAGTHFVDGTAANIKDNYAPVNYVAASATVDGNFAGIDTKLGTIAGSAITALTSDVVATGPGSVAATIQPNVVTNAKLAQAPANTIKGNNTAGLANEADLTATQVTAMLNPFVGDSGAGGTQGLVPAPGAGTYASGDFLAANGSWLFVDQSKTRNPDFAQVASIPQLVGGGHSENTFVFTHSNGKQYALVSGGGTVGTMEMYDVSDQTNPILVNSGTYTGSYNITANVIAGSTYAFIPASGAHTLVIVNITNPYSWTTVSTTTVGGVAGSVYSAVYAAGYVYCATQNNGLVVFDAGGGAVGGTLAVPVQSYMEGGAVKSFGVAISGNFVYTTQFITAVFGTRQIKSWALTGAGTLSVPSLVQSFQVTTAGEALGITISGNTAFVTVTTAGVNSINLIDITTPSAMANLSQITPSYSMNSGYVGVASGNFLFIPSGSNAGNGGAIDMYDITTRTAPFKIDTIYSGLANDVFGGIAISGGYIFVGRYGTAGAIGPFTVYSMPNLLPVFGAGLGSTLTLESLTPNTALISSASDGIISSITTATELSYVHGVTSSIQAQINAISAGTIPFTDIVAASQTIAVNNGYTASNAGAVTFTLPAVAAYGTTFEISTGSTAGGWVIAQAAGQSIRNGNLVTTVGVGGSLASTNQGDSVRVLCIVANTTFQVLSSQGEINVT